MIRSRIGTSIGLMALWALCPAQADTGTKYSNIPNGPHATPAFRGTRASADFEFLPTNESVDYGLEHRPKWAKGLPMVLALPEMKHPEPLTPEQGERDFARIVESTSGTAERSP